MLAVRTVAFQRGKCLTYIGTSAKLTVLKKDPELAFLNDVSCVPLQQTLRHLQTAFVNFFAKRSAYPAFKKKKNKTRDSAEYTRSAFRFNRASQRLTLAKLGVLHLRISRRVEIDPTTVTVTRHPSGRYYVSIVLAVATPPTKAFRPGRMSTDLTTRSHTISTDGIPSSHPDALPERMIPHLHQHRWGRLNKIPHPLHTTRRRTTHFSRKRTYR